MFNRNTPAQGSLLISEPFILDPNFERSVVILCEHDSNGTVGLVLNHPSNLFLSDVIEDLNGKEYPIYIGGPVQNDALFFLHCIPDKISGSIPVGQGIFWGGELEQVVAMIQQQILLPKDIKFFFGYSGWSFGQLEEEIEQNSWAVHNSFEPTLPFLTDTENLWKKALISLGPKYAHVAKFPKNPYLN